MEKFSMLKSIFSRQRRRLPIFKQLYDENWLKSKYGDNPGIGSLVIELHDLLHIYYELDSGEYRDFIEQKKIDVAKLLNTHKVDLRWK